MKEFIDIIKSDKKSKMLFIITIGVLFICTVSYSLSIFSNNKEGKAANIIVNGLSFNMTTNTGETDDRILKLKANTLESFNVVLTNLNTMDVKYELIYEVCTDNSCTSTLDKLPDDVVFGIHTDSTGKITDTLIINGNTNIFILSNNSTNTDYYIKLNLNAGYSWNELALINQIDTYHKDIDFIAYVDGVEQDKFPDGCYYGYTYKTYEKGIETTDSEVTLRCDNETGKWKIIVDNIPNKVKVWFKYKVTGKIISLYKNGGTSYLKYDGMTDATVSNDGTGNLRYYGGNPNNYISFNNELWRIMGVFEIYNPDKEKTETSTYIIRNDALNGLYSWDSSPSSINSGYGINEWSQADLMRELNTDYLNPNLTRNPMWYNGINNQRTATFDKSQAIKEEYQQYIMNARWYLGGINTEKISAATSYVREASTTVFQNASDGVTRTKYWDGKIGLMYPSDYGFASADETCQNNLYNCDNENNRNNNWLYVSREVESNKYYEWMISPYSENATGVFVLATGTADSIVYDEGYVDYYGDWYDDYEGGFVRPVLCLNNNTLITRGTGTISDPYQISM